MRSSVFLKKVVNRLSNFKNRLWKHCNLDSVSMIGFQGFSRAEELGERLSVLLGDYSVKLVERITEKERLNIIECSEQALQHKFDLLGSGVVQIDPIDWHRDFKSGKRWDKSFYRNQHKTNGSDIKVPWELSRCQHLLWLGEAYLLTEDKRYAKEVIDEINWWIDDNPLMYSVNWTCAMDVAFRAVNWMFALNMISKYEGFDDAFTSKVSKSFWDHGFFIRNVLEKQVPFSNNHYASDIVGLLYLGALFQNTKKGRKWLHFALKEYYSETRVQVLPSGVHYERSVSYHRLMTELLSYPVYMLRRIGEQIPADILNLIQGMYAYIANYTKPNGFAPLIADNDDGRFVPFLKRDFREHNYLNDNNSIENRFVSCGGKVIFHSNKRNSNLYSDAGVAILRNEYAYVIINNEGYSKHPKETDITIGSHTHNDLLSFEINIDGQDIIVDPGTYVYTSNILARDEFRSTKKHNTVVVDGEEQNGFAAPFVLIRNVKVGLLQQHSNSVISGEYTTIKGQMHHKRRFELVKEGLTITDTVTKKGARHCAILYYHMAKDMTPRIKECLVVLNDSIVIEFSQQPNNLVIVEDTLSPSYGVLIESKTVVASFPFDNELNVNTKIRKYG